MKKNNIFLLISAFVLMLSGCLKEEELEGNKPTVLEPMTFYAKVESGADTKTAIGGEVGDDIRYLMWLPEDSIGIYNSKDKKLEPFVNINTEESVSAVFEGSNVSQDTYYAIYPYSKSHSYASTTMTVDLPVVQQYAENSFGNKANPMVAYAESGKELYFQNLGGILVINLTGEVSVKSLSVSLLDESGNYAPVSGKHTVSMDYIEGPLLKPTEESARVVTLDCGDGVALSSSVPTPFHVVVPSGRYSGVTLTVVTSDGKVMVKQGTNPLRIRRTRVSSAGALEFEAVEAVDLSLRGTSNCYIVSEPGVYSFDASVIGNGEYGLVPDAGFHTDDVNITPSSADLMWEDVHGLILATTYTNGKIVFNSSDKKGNAVIAARDASGTIIWSWHIWVTDEPVEQTYVNTTGTYILQDRNIGAIRSDRGNGDEWEESVGMLYQWGRKDPLSKEIYTSDRTIRTIAATIKYPDHQASTGSWNHTYHWEENHNNKLWTPTQKTIYDPCPVGYMVADINAYYELYPKGDFNKGYYVPLSESSQSWFPVTPMIYCSGSYVEADSDIILWASNITNNSSFRRLHIKSNDVSTKCWEGYDNAMMTSPVRCMKDDNHVDISLPQVEILEISDITTSSAKVVVNVKSPGISEVTEKGIIWGTMSDLSDGIRVECGSGNEDFTVNLTEFEKASKYYVRPYAKSKRGEAYGPVKVLTTLYVDGVVNLSLNGTSNCYQIIPQYVVASFDCSVKGNSDESVGDIFSLEVLWETDSFMRKAELGTILKSVRLENNTAIITLSDEALEGNALVAAKDESGVILWSWHIWVTDTPEDHVYKANNSSWVVQDRHLGATRGDYSDGDDWKESCGIDYQWGRKDPISSGNFTIVDEVYTVERAVQNPTVLAEWERADGLWSPDVKTMYDPCPVGYMVASKEVYECLQPSNIDVSNGCYFIYDGLNTAWYPFRGYPGQYGDIAYWRDNYMWYTTMVNTCIYYSDGRISTSNSVAHGNTQDRSPVRCMKDE